MKDKKIIYGAVAAIVIIVLLVIIVVVTSKGSSKNPYGFKSEYTESTLEENQLRNFPEVKDKMLELEECILNSGLTIEKIEFNDYSTSGVYYLGKTEVAQDYIVLDMDKDSEEYKIYSLETKIFDDSKYDGARDAIVKFLEISDDESKIISEMTTEDNEVQTMEYIIYYYEREEEVHPDMGEIKAESYEEFEEEYSKVKKAPYKMLEVINHPAEDERQTNLYAVKREERKPKADGQNIDEYGISFYIPSALKANPYNGTFYTYEFYTGDYVGYSPEGVTVSLYMKKLDDDKDLDSYVRNDSRPAKSTGVTPFETKEINGKTWYTCNNGKIYYYAAEFFGNVYEIEVADGKVIDGVTLDDTLKMIEATLFFE